MTEISAMCTLCGEDQGGPIDLARHLILAHPDVRGPHMLPAQDAECVQRVIEHVLEQHGPQALMALSGASVAQLSAMGVPFDFFRRGIDGMEELDRLDSLDTGEVH